MSWLYHQTGANPSPGSLKRGISTLKLQVLIRSSGKGENEQSRKEGGLASRPTGTKLQPPTFPVPQDSQTPSLSRETRKKKAHATHSHALVGNQEKFICVNRSNREQQNPPAYSQDTVESGMSQSVRGQSRGRGRCTCRKECRAVQRREPVARQRYFLHRVKMEPEPHIGDITTPT